MNRRQFISTGIVLLSSAGIAQSMSAKEKSKPIFRFAIASDGHYGQAGTRYGLFHSEMMGWLNAEHAIAPLNFCVFNGDLVHDEPALLADVKDQFEELKFPYYVTRGNHDRCDAATWRNTWGRDLNYTVEADENAFIMLDTSNEKGEYLCPKLDWVEMELARLKRHQHLFIFMHIPPVLWNESFADCKEVVALFSRQNNLRAIFHGHDHQSDNARIENGKPYIFDGHMGGNWGTEYRGYRIVEMYSSGHILTYQVNPNSKIRVNENKLG